MFFYILFYGIANEINVENDIVKVCVLERHNYTGHIGKAYLKGYGLKNGAIATTVAHDSHNIIVAGVSEQDMAIAVMKLKEIGGGMVLVLNGEVLDYLSLPIAGLISDKPIEEVQKKIENLKDISRKLGITNCVDPFMTLSFLSLPVIPHIKLITTGVIDVDNMRLIEYDL